MSVENQIRKLSGYCPAEIREHNRKLDRVLRRKFKMTLLHWKSIKWIVMLAFVYLAVELTNEGADPIIVLLVVAVVLGGSEVLEYIAVAQDFQDFREEKENEDGK